MEKRSDRITEFKTALLLSMSSMRFGAGGSKKKKYEYRVFESFPNVLISCSILYKVTEVADW